MSLIENYFGKSGIEHVTYDHIVSFFSIDKKESDRLEFKSYDPRENINGRPKTEKEHFETILESIVASLNSDGGILIWGAPAGVIKEGDKEKSFIGEPILIPFKYEDDQIIRKITDKINPIPNRVRKKIIEKDGKYIYVFEVERSEYSPHQVNNLFYMRIDGATKIAPYHYIEALFKKIKSPDIRGYIKIENWTQHKELMPPTDEYHLRISAIIFNFSKLQNDYNLTYNILTDIGSFENSKSLLNSPNTKYPNSGLLRRLNVKDIIFYGEPIIEKYTIIINPYELNKSNYVANIVLFFGTKLSPMKCSRYKINLKYKNLDNHNKNMFLEISENQLMSEFKEELNLTDQDTLRDMLLR